MSSERDSEGSSKSLVRGGSARDTEWTGLATSSQAVAWDEVATRRRTLKQADTGLWESRLSEMYVRWINSRLRERRDAGQVRLVEDLAIDLRSGVVLCHLLEALSGRSLKTRLNARGTTKIHHISNLTVYFGALQEVGVKTVNVGPNDVYDGNVRCILGLMWTNICFFAMRDEGVEVTDERGALKQTLLAWATELIGDDSELLPLSHDFKAAFGDGRLFAAMLKSLDPDAPDFDDTLSAADNLRRTFERADEVFSVPVLIDVSVPNSMGDEQALITYLCEFKHCVQQPVKIPMEEPLPEDTKEAVEDEEPPVVEEEEVQPMKIKVAVGLHRGRALLGGREINPYCVVKYGAKEVKTSHDEATPDPAWDYQTLFDVVLPLDDAKAVIIVYIFSANTYFADSLIGKCEVLLANLVDACVGDDLTMPCCLMKPSFLAVLPCDTREQDDLRHIAFSGTRSVQRHLNIFHDPMLLYKNAGYLGAIEVSVFSMGTAFNLIS